MADIVTPVELQGLIGTLPGGAMTAPPPGTVPAEPTPAQDGAPAGTSLRLKLRQGVDTSNMDPRMTARANRLFDLMPEKLRDSFEVTDAVRSREKQAAAYERFQAGTGGLAAAPGNSQHDPSRRAALDIASGPALTWLHGAEGKKALETSGLAMPFAAQGDPGHMQLSEAGARAEAVRQGKGVVSDTEVQDMIAALPKRGEESTTAKILRADQTLTVDPMSGMVRSDDPEMNAALQEANKAAFHGIRRGLQELVTGPAEAVLPDAVFAPVRQKINEFESQFDEVIKNNPGPALGGKILGSTIGILGGAGALGAGMKASSFIPRALTTVWEGLGLFGRSVVTGAAFGGTEYYPEPDKEQRLFGVPARAFDATVGGMFGAMGAVVARGVQWAARNLSETTYGGAFLDLLKRNTDGVTRNSEVPLQEALTHYTAVEKRGAALYGLTNSAGRRIEGFPTGIGDGEAAGMSQALSQFRDGQKIAAIPVTPKAATAAKKAEFALGLDIERNRFAAWEAQNEVYAERLAEAQAARPKFDPIRPGTSPEEAAATLQMRERMIQQQEAAGALPPLPKPPEPFVPRPVRAAQYSEARKVVNAQFRGKLTPADRTQLQMLQREIDGVAKNTAAELGMGTEEFIRKAGQADRFHEEIVAPLRNNVFGGQSSAVVKGREGVPFSGMTPAEFYDKIVGIVNKDDTVATKDLREVLGEKGRESVTQIVMAEALQKMEKGVPQTIEYIQSHQNVLRELLGPDKYKNLLGQAKVAEHIRPHNANEVQRIWQWGHSIGPAFGMYQLFHAGSAAVKGTGHVGGHLLEAGVMFGAVPMAHLLTRITQSIHAVPIVKPLVSRAATLKPGSPEMDGLVREIERRVRAWTAVGARAATQ